MSGYHLPQLLDKMTSADADFRFMALNDLVNDLSKNILDNHLQKKCSMAVLKCLSDTNSTVQNVAIKCVTVLFSKLNDEYALEVLDRLLEMITDSKSEGLVAGIALKAIILESPEYFSGYMKRVFPKLVFLLDKNSSVDQILDAIDILAKILSSFSGVEELTDVQLGGCQGGLWNLIRNHPRQAVQKRACGALASLSCHLSDAAFKNLLDNIKGVLVDSFDTTSTKIFVYGLAVISKASGSRMGPYLSDWVDVVLNLRKNNVDDEISEYCLQTLEYWVVKCPMEVTNYIQKILDTGLFCVAYDPNYNYDEDDDEQNGMDLDHDQTMSDSSGEEDDEDGFSDEDDMSWKTRKAAARLLSSLFSTRKEFISDFYNQAAPVVVKRFKERIESVRLEIIIAFTALVKQTNILTESRTKGASKKNNIGRETKKMRYDVTSSGATYTDSRQYLVTYVPTLCKQIHRHFQQSKSPETAACNYALLKEIANVIPGALEPEMDKIVTFFESSFNSSLGASSNLRFEMLEFMMALFQPFSVAILLPHLQKILCFLLEAANDKFSNNAKEALVVIKSIIKVIRPIQVDSCTNQTNPNVAEHLTTIYAFVLKKGSDADADLAVREQAISCLSTVLCHANDILSKESIKQEVIPLILNRLQNESYRISSLRFITEVSAYLDINQISFSDSLSFLYDEIAIFLRKSHRPLLLQALQCLVALLKRYNAIADPVKMLNEIRHLLDELDVHLFTLTLSAVTNIIRISNSQKLVMDCIRTSYVPKIISSIEIHPHLLNLDYLQDFWAAFTTEKNPNMITFCLDELYKTSIVDKYTKMSHVLASKCIAHIFSKSDKTFVFGYCGKIMENMLKEISAAQKHLILLSLGEIGSQVDFLEGFPSLFEDVFKLFDASSAEDVRFAAAFALGNISLGNVERHLPRIIELIKKQVNQQFLLFITLKEVIVKLSSNSAQEILRKVAPEIWNILFINTETVKQETIRNAIAECLGKISQFDPSTYLPLLRAQTSSKSAHTRSTALIALRHTFPDSSSQLGHFDSVLSAVLPEFILKVDDKDQSVKKAALAMVISAVHHKSNLIEPLLGNLFPLIYGATIIDEKQIHYVEMGPFKHKVDNGLEARKAAFDCLYAFMESYLPAVNLSILLDHIIRGITDDSHEIRIVNFLMLQRLARTSPTVLSHRLEDLIAPLKETLLFKPKANAVKLEIERSKELAVAAARTCYVLAKLESSKFSSFLEDTRNSSTFLAEIFGNIAMEPSTSSMFKTLDITDL